MYIFSLFNVHYHFLVFVTHIKESTIKSWRSRGVIPEDKKLLLNTLISKYELIQENEKYRNYFKLQNELTIKAQK